jgi:hypothetical protein
LDELNKIPEKLTAGVFKINMLFRDFSAEIGPSTVGAESLVQLIEIQQSRDLISPLMDMWFKGTVPLKMCLTLGLKA